MSPKGSKPRIHNLVIYTSDEQLGGELQKMVTSGFSLLEWRIIITSRIPEKADQAQYRTRYWQMVDSTLLEELPPEKRNNHPLNCANTIIINRSDLHQTIKLIGDFSNVNHVISGNSEALTLLLPTLLERVITPSIWQENNLIQNNAIESHKEKISSYQLKNSYLDSIRESLKGLNSFPDFCEMAVTIASELIMNAIFDAPFDFKSQSPKYAHLSRREPLKLEGAEQVNLSYGYNDELLVISVSDNFGRLDRNSILSNLERCARGGDDQIRTEGGGAGAGLYAIFNTATCVDIRTIKNQKTTVSVTMALKRRMRDYENMGISFNYFEK
jgi:uncharacterized protein YnzC (UPF0291/DUF896 family)